MSLRGISAQEEKGYSSTTSGKFGTEDSSLRVTALSPCATSIPLTRSTAVLRTPLIPMMARARSYAAPSTRHRSRTQRPSTLSGPRRGPPPAAGPSAPPSSPWARGPAAATGGTGGGLGCLLWGRADRQARRHPLELSAEHRREVAGVRQDAHPPEERRREPKEHGRGGGDFGKVLGALPHAADPPLRIELVEAQSLPHRNLNATYLHVPHYAYGPGSCHVIDDKSQVLRYVVAKVLQELPDCLPANCRILESKVVMHAVF
eukprot:CAMPEP_0177583948 /NCGR_PEP_ID=MMETSP0419_2-20121207/3615_1 /TAXON_ID=582737 /ORGANISM="Tetraselmis sp., Strain GSL018" /LENGTH=260 /DNA_ID=CAMNT_0019073415 /DNA_START=453 /DNA_END=1235 /DNA_ORIENTATION=-